MWGETRTVFIRRALVFALLAASVLLLAFRVAGQVEGAGNPEAKGPCAVANQSVEIAGAAARVFYPSTETCGNYAAEPFAAIAFAHGFSMFGLSDGVSENAANGEHLASWGYVVVIPKLPDDAEERAGMLMEAISFLESASKNSGSFLYGKVDTKRLVTAGHSLGGATALSVAAREKRIAAVVALDPVYHIGGFGGEGRPIWNPATEGPKIVVPTGILGAPASSCNAGADYADIYLLIGSSHKASYLINGASHCVFADPGGAFCGLVCNGDTAPELTSLSKKYMVAWLNYYVQGYADYYEYLYGAHMQADVAAGSIDISRRTSPTNLTASETYSSIQLSWEHYAHPVVAGYHIYRRLSTEPSFGSPLASVIPTSSYTDFQVDGGQEYVYAVRSFDSAGNLHQLSNEVRIKFEPAVDDPTRNYLPLVGRS